jgi:hypothetical protein
VFGDFDDERTEIVTYMRYVFSDSLFFRGYLCLLFVVFFWTCVRSTLNNEIANRDPNAELLGIVF